MTTVRRDIAATVATALVVFALLRSVEGVSKNAFWALALIAGTCAILASATGELTPMSLMLATIVLLWLVSALRDVWHVTHRPMTT